MKYNGFPFGWILAGFLAATGLWIGGCAKSTPFGAELLDGDVADFSSDTFSVQATVLPEDSLITSSTSESSYSMLAGEVDHPVFGKTRSEIYTLIRTTQGITGFSSSITTVVDSVVMFLTYVPGNITGDTTVPHTLRVHRLAQALRWDSVYYGHNSLSIGEEVGALENFLPVPRKKDSVSVVAPNATFLRIPMNNSFGEAIAGLDSVTLNSDTLFWNWLRGLRIAVTPASQPGAMLAFDLNNENSSFIRIYTRRINGTDTTSRILGFEFDGGNKFLHFEHDYSGTPVAGAINQINPDVVYVQSAQGLRVKIELPDTTELPRDAVINQALLEFTLVPPTDMADDFYPAVPQIYLTEYQGDTVYVPVPDVIFSTTFSSLGNFNEFGGQPSAVSDNGVSVTRYFLNISELLQYIYTDSRRRTVYLNVFPQTSKLAQSAFYGPLHPDFPVRLTIKFTRINPF